jgi:molecular chaperone DnaK (HSP70)
VLEVDTNGVLNVTATNKAVDMTKEMTIVGDKGRLSKDEIAKMQ